MDAAGRMGGRTIVKIRWLSAPAADHAQTQVLQSADMLHSILDRLGRISIQGAAPVCRSWREAAARKVLEWRVLTPSHTMVSAPGERYSEFVTTLCDWTRPTPSGETVWVIVSDTHQNRMACLDRDGRKLASVGRLGSGPLEFNKPRGLATDGTGLYVVESGNQRVQKISLPREDGSWAAESLAVSPAAPGRPLKGPMGLALSQTKNKLFVTDTHNHRVAVFSTDTLAYLSSFGATGARPGEFDCPCGIAEHKGELFVADHRNNRVQVFSDEGSFLRVLGGAEGRLVAPYGVTAVACSPPCIVVSENTAGRLQARRGPCALRALRAPAPATRLFVTRQVFSLDGRALQTLQPRSEEPSGEEADAFWLYGLCADSRRAYVTDGSNGNVHVLDVRADRQPPPTDRATPAANGPTSPAIAECA